MCAFCDRYPLLLQREIIHNEKYYTHLSIRSIENKMIFNVEYFSITQPGDWYWSVPGISICGSCLIRQIVDNIIQWMPNDYKDMSMTHSLNGQMINIGNELLNKVNKLKVFL